MDCFGSKDKSPEQDPERQPLAKEAGSSNPKLGPLVTTLMKSEIYIYTILTGDEGWRVHLKSFYENILRK